MQIVANSTSLRMASRTCVRQRAFTLIEMIAVVVVLGIVAAGSIPAFDAIRSAQHAGCAADLERIIITARARAMATATPTGITLSRDGRHITIVELPQDGELRTVQDLFQTPMPAIDLAGSWGGNTVSRFVNGDGTNRGRTIWFNHRAEPQTRDDDGADPTAFMRDALYTLANGDVVRVRRITGAVDRR
jgi:prepilin-type N-terminal cleavage/methylation domain-containing protein